jgi:hypothetical protein
VRSNSRAHGDVDLEVFTIGVLGRAEVAAGLIVIARRG